MSEADDIQIDPGICGGKPVLRGTRVAVSIVLGSLVGGMSLQEVELDTLEWVDWFNHKHLLSFIGDAPPPEAEETHYRHASEFAVSA